MHLTRRDLYDMIWSAPMQEVSAKIDLPVERIVDICHRYRIPVPSPHHWRSKASGKRVTEVRLIATADPADETIDLGIRKRRVRLHEGSRSDEPVIVSVPPPRERKPSKAPPEYAKLERPHPLLAETARYLRLAERRGPDHSALREFSEQVWRDKTFGCPVERRLNVMDTIVRRLEKTYALSFDKYGLVAEAQGEKVWIALNEIPDRVPHVDTPEEIWQRRRDEALYGKAGLVHSPRRPKTDALYVGRLVVMVGDNPRWMWRHNFKDGVRSIVEDRYDEIVASVAADIEARVTARLQRERSERNDARRRRRDERERRRQERDKKRLEVIDELVDVQLRIDRLRKWLDAVADWDRGGDAGDFGRMVEWVQAQIEKLERVHTQEALSGVLRTRKLFPESDDLIDPPEDLIVE